MSFDTHGPVVRLRYLTSRSNYHLVTTSYHEVPSPRRSTRTGGRGCSPPLTPCQPSQGLSDAPQEATQDAPTLHPYRYPTDRETPQRGPQRPTGHRERVKGRTGQDSAGGATGCTTGTRGTPGGHAPLPRSDRAAVTLSEPPGRTAAGRGVLGYG